MSLTVGSLFSGIGGLDLGLERAGMTVRWQSEIDPYASRVLAKHWPHVPNLGDIKLIDWENDGIDHGDGIAHSLHVDLICGGYPCQPFSYAGSRNGATDPRHLWPYFLTAVRHLRPRWALLENVSGHLSLGFGRVLGDLAESGYDVEWDCIPAAAVGAPHLRDRVFAVAHTDREGEPGDPVDAVTGPGELVPDPSSARREGELVSVGARPAFTGAGRGGEDVADPDRGGRVGRPWIFGPGGRRQLADRRRRATQPGVGGAPDGISRWLDGSWEAGVDRVTRGVPNRVSRLKCLGNAVVPQVAEFVGRRIMESEAG